MPRRSRSRSRSRSRDRERKKDRNRDKDRERDRDRLREHKRKHSRERNRRRSKSRSRTRSISRSPRYRRDKKGSPSRRDRSASSSRSSSSSSHIGLTLGNIKQKQTALTNSDKPIILDPNEIAGKTQEEIEMLKLMGFSGFDSTKGKHVDGSCNAYAVNIQQKRRYRQYMNRKGGFNRPLDPVA